MYGKYSDRFEDAPRYLGVPDSDETLPVVHELISNTVMNAAVDKKIPKWPHIVKNDPRFIRRNADF